MRIAFIYYILASNVVGLEKKIEEQARCSPNNFDFFLLNRFKNGKIGRVNLIRINSSKNYYDYFFRKFDLIEKSINLSKYDYIILRYPFADKTSLKFIQKYNVISEHHTNEIAELKGNLINPSPLFTKFASLIRLWLEYKYGNKYRQNCKGIVSVTNEIRNKEIVKINEHIPSITISNGIDVKGIKITGFNTLTANEFNLIFVIGKLSPWHGLERIIRSLENYNGKYAINLHLVGDIKRSDLKIDSDVNIKFYGIKKGVELDNIFSKATMAISTLGLYKKNMEEAASLKTREYTARGIPFLLAYDDVDLLNIDENRKFYLKFPNNSENIQIERVISFCEELSKKYKKTSELSEYMHNYALKNMDWRPKMKKYIEFCRRIEIE